jgi:hypothetical protein
MERKNTISTADMKSLLISLHAHTVIRIRIRLFGRMWEDHFADIIRVTEEVVIIQACEHRELKSIPISDVIQFELEDRFQMLDCFSHYTVRHEKITSPESSTLNQPH